MDAPGLLAAARRTEAACNIIPPATPAFRASLGATDRPFARARDWVRLTLDPACHGSSLVPVEDAPVVTIVFMPTDGSALFRDFDSNEFPVLTERSEFTKRSQRMDRPTAIFVDGLGAAAATSGILTQLQGRIFALLYLQPRPIALEDIATELEQSKSNVSVNIRGLVEWHLVRRTRVAGSRKDHYEAATDFWRVMQEIFERRFRWMVRQVLATVDETRDVAKGQGRRTKPEAAFVDARLDAMRAFFTALDAGISAFAQGKSVGAEAFQGLSSPPRALSTKGN
jgi:DNA-binding transcriptional regulator GbsR (MarR family)